MNRISLTVCAHARASLGQWEALGFFWKEFWRWRQRIGGIPAQVAQSFGLRTSVDAQLPRGGALCMFAHLAMDTMSNHDEEAKPAPGEAGSVDPHPEEPNFFEVDMAEWENLKLKAAKADEHWQQVLRITADLDNYKKRAARERDDAVRFANKSILERLLPVLDNFEMALAAVNDPKSGGVDALKTGVTMIYNQLRQTMVDSGLEEIDAARQMFDPNLHEAVSQQESATVPEGQILQQLRRGYRLRDRLLRPASVVVAKKPAQ
jgi:molecular chaperone GrpE